MDKQYACISVFKHCPPSSPLQPAHVKMVAHAFSTATAASVHAPLDTLGSIVKMYRVSILYRMVGGPKP